MAVDVEKVLHLECVVIWTTGLGQSTAISVSRRLVIYPQLPAAIPKCYLLALLLALQAFNPQDAFAWSGYDSGKGSHGEIEKGNLVRSGQDIEIYDYGTGEYKEVEVQSIRQSGSSVEVEVYDYQTGEYRRLEMDD